MCSVIVKILCSDEENAEFVTLEITPKYNEEKDEMEYLGVSNEIDECFYGKDKDEVIKKCIEFLQTGWDEVEIKKQDWFC